jgi:hypothetical protein
MRLSNIFEQDPATATGAASVSRAMGSAASGASVARALGKASHGDALNPTLVKSIAPYADALDKILSTPAFRNKFTQLIKQVQSLDKKNQEIAAQQGAVTEDQDSVDAVASSITRRIMMQHTELLSKYGPVKVMAAIDDVAEFAGGDGLDEIGSSDVSIWTKQVIQDLEAGHYDRVEETEQLDEILPQIGAALATRAVGAGASAITRGIAGAAGRVAGTYAQDKIQSALDDNDEDPTDDASTGDAVDTVTMDIPLLLRVLEFAREEADEDMDLHDLAERLIALSKDGPLSMDDYDSVVSAPVDEVSNKTLSSYTDKAAKERDTYHADRNKDAESARKYYNRKAGVRKALSITKEDQLDELSPQTLGSYVSKSVKDEKERRAHGIRVRDELRAATGKNFGTPIDRKLYSPTASRASGQKRAIDKLTGKSKVPAQEGYYTPGPETMPGAVGPAETTNVSYNQTKRMGDATVTVSANAKDMEELHRVLKLAGIEVKGVADAEPSVADAAVALAPNMPAEPAEEPCGYSSEPESGVKPLDFKYSTDKTALVNVLRDRLKRL